MSRMLSQEEQLRLLTAAIQDHLIGKPIHAGAEGVAAQLLTAIWAAGLRITEYDPAQPQDRA